MEWQHHRYSEADRTGRGGGGESHIVTLHSLMLLIYVDLGFSGVFICIYIIDVAFPTRLSIVIGYIHLITVIYRLFDVVVLVRTCLVNAKMFVYFLVSKMMDGRSEDDAYGRQAIAAACMIGW